MSDAWFFDRFAAVYDRVMWAADRETIEPGFDVATIDVETVLDLAGGSGRVARVLAADYDVTVADLSRPMLEEARGHGLACVQGDATRLPVPDAGVDAVVIADAYHHFPDPSSVLEDVHRILAHGGVVVVREFDPTTLRGRGVVLSERLMGWPATFRSPEALTGDLSAAGFDSTILEEGFGYTAVGRKPESGT